MRFPNKFIDPTGVKTTYEWQVNHNEEDSAEKTRNIEHGSNTANTGLIRQQGSDSPSKLRVQGTILHQAQLTEMWEWFALTRTQTIYFEDFAGDKAEVIITEFDPIRHRTMRNPRDFANAPLWYWTYTLEFEFLRFIEGPMADAGVTP